MHVSVSCVVEGHGEREAVPVLVRRIAQELTPPVTVEISRPIRIPKTKLLKDGELERAVELATRIAKPHGGILVLLDSDTDCPAQLGPHLHQRAITACSGFPLAVILAKHEFEAWFLASANSLSGQRGLSGCLHPPPDPESIQDPKGWLSSHMGGGRNYRETLDQPALAALFDLTAARHLDSFDKCYREVARLVSGLRSGGPSVPSANEAAD